MRPHAHTALLSSVTHACCPTTSSHCTTTAPLCDGAGHSLSTQVRDAKFPMPRLVRCDGPLPASPAGCWMMRATTGVCPPAIGETWARSDQQAGKPVTVHMSR